MWCGVTDFEILTFSSRTWTDAADAYARVIERVYEEVVDFAEGIEHNAGLKPLRSSYEVDPIEP